MVTAKLQMARSGTFPERKLCPERIDYASFLDINRINTRRFATSALKPEELADQAKP